MGRGQPGLGGLAWRLALVLAFAGALGWWLLSQVRTRRSTDVAAEVEAPVADLPVEPQWRPRDKVELAPGCQPQASRVCLRGDSWWLDSCGEPHELANDCGLSLCEAGECEPPPLEDCGGMPAVGRCDGDTAEVCAAGRPMSIDCGADGLRCVMTEYGPACRVPTDNDCTWPPGTTRCEGDILQMCHEGRLRAIDCATLDAACVTTDAIARCVAEVPAAAVEDGCGPCGCSDDGTSEEVCDGRDNDGDGHIDEDGCDPVDIVAFVVTDERGNSSYTEEDLVQELERVNKAFAREDGYGLTFRLAETLWLKDRELLVTDEIEFDRLVDTMRYPERQDVFVPVLFTDRVYIEGVPRPGASTVPNGACGGKRRDPAWQPAIGLIAIAKRRWPTTVAHEIGHFLGLCHTHGDHVDAVVRVANADGERIACDESCVLEADGICDTPPDPGPAECTVGDACTIACANGEVPDGRNLMGYYPDCRSVFSRQQALLMRQSLHLRRGWQPCALGDGCACEIIEANCPPQMSCRMGPPNAEGLSTGGRCGMDGASIPGGVCRDSRDCSQGAACMTAPSGDSLCIRPCTEQTPACDCRELPGNPWPICLQDTHRATP